MCHLASDEPVAGSNVAVAIVRQITFFSIRAYVDDQIRDHEKTIALFEREAKTGKDAELKAFAEKTLPALKEHLSMVRDLKTKLTKGGTN